LLTFIFSKDFLGFPRNTSWNEEVRQETRCAILQAEKMVWYYASFDWFSRCHFTPNPILGTPVSRKRIRHKRWVGSAVNHQCDWVSCLGFNLSRTSPCLHHVIEHELCNNINEALDMIHENDSYGKWK